MIIQFVINIPGPQFPGLSNRVEMNYNIKFARSHTRSAAYSLYLGAPRLWSRAYIAGALFSSGVTDGKLHLLVWEIKWFVCIQNLNKNERYTNTKSIVVANKLSQQIIATKPKDSICNDSIPKLVTWDYNLKVNVVSAYVLVWSKKFFGCVTKATKLLGSVQKNIRNL